MEERSLERLAELIHNHVHSSHLVLIASIHVRVDENSESALNEATHRTRDSMWKTIIHLMQEERDIIDALADAIEKKEPCTAGNLGCIVDCCNEKLDELRTLAEANDIPWAE